MKFQFGVRSMEFLLFSLPFLFPVVFIHLFLFHSSLVNIHFLFKTSALHSCTAWKDEFLVIRPFIHLTANAKRVNETMLKDNKIPSWGRNLCLSVCLSVHKSSTHVCIYSLFCPWSFSAYFMLPYYLKQNSQEACLQVSYLSICSLLHNCSNI